MRQPKQWAGLLAVLLGVGLFFTQWVQAAPLQQTPTPFPYLFFPLVKAAIPPTPTALPTPTATPVPFGPPPASESVYMKSVDPQTLYNLGCQYGTKDLNAPGTQDSVVILDFGRPRLENGQLGTKIFYGGLVTMGQIGTATKYFGQGYYMCSGADTLSHITIGVGTNNYAYEDCPNCAVTYDHGHAWALMVNDANSWFLEKGYSGQVSAVGANDIELSWNYPQDTFDWLNGYDSVNTHELLNFGALPGCPYFAAPGAQCGSYPYLWSKDQVWFAIWGSPPVYPLPEIYSNSGVNAQQWYLMSVYAYDNHGMALEFRGVMTQYESCQQRTGDAACEYLDNTPAQGWQQLNDLVNGNSKTRHFIKWLTDIQWFGE
jgi:hypothetical protein